MLTQIPGSLKQKMPDLLISKFNLSRSTVVRSNIVELFEYFDTVMTEIGSKFSKEEISLFFRDLDFHSEIPALKKLVNKFLMKKPEPVANPAPAANLFKVADARELSKINEAIIKAQQVPVIQDPFPISKNFVNEAIGHTNYYETIVGIHRTNKDYMNYIRDNIKKITDLKIKSKKFTHDIIIEKLKKEFEIISKNPEFEKVYFDSKAGILHAVTAENCLLGEDKVNFGKFDITYNGSEILIYPYSNNLAYDAGYDDDYDHYDDDDDEDNDDNYDENGNYHPPEKLVVPVSVNKPVGNMEIASSGKASFHPHVFENEFNMCYGNATATFSELFEAFNIAGIFTITNLILHEYNDEAPIYDLCNYKKLFNYDSYLKITSKHRIHKDMVSDLNQLKAVAV